MSDGASAPNVEWGDWGPPVRVRVDQAPVVLFARAVQDRSPVYASEQAARAAGFEAVPVPPTFTFVMTHSGAHPDLQPEGATGTLQPPDSHLPSDGVSRSGLFLHGEQHFTYHRTVHVGDVLEGRMRVSRPIARLARRGPMEVTHLQTEWCDLDGAPVVTERIVSLYFPEG